MRINVRIKEYVLLLSFVLSLFCGFVSAVNSVNLSLVIVAWTIVTVVVSKNCVKLFKLIGKYVLGGNMLALLFSTTVALCNHFGKNILFYFGMIVVMLVTYVFLYAYITHVSYDKKAECDKIE